MSHATFREFALSKELLGLPDMDLEFSIARESNHNIDIWIESDNHVIVIENKIRSGVNGLDGDRSQLDKYKANAEAHALEHGKLASFYVFVPDYNNTEFSKFDPEGTWKIVPYSAIHGFFARNAASYIEDWYFPEFLRALERQTMTMAELNFRTMKSRFIKKIVQAQ